MAAFLSDPSTHITTCPGSAEFLTLAAERWTDADEGQLDPKEMGKMASL